MSNKALFDFNWIQELQKTENSKLEKAKEFIKSTKVQDEKQFSEDLRKKIDLLKETLELKLEAICESEISFPAYYSSTLTSYQTLVDFTGEKGFITLDTQSLFGSSIYYKDLTELSEPINVDNFVDFSQKIINFEEKAKVYSKNFEEAYIKKYFRFPAEKDLKTVSEIKVAIKNKLKESGKLSESALWCLYLLSWYDSDSIAFRPSSLSTVAKSFKTLKDQKVKDSAKASNIIEDVLNWNFDSSTNSITGSAMFYSTEMGKNMPTALDLMAKGNKSSLRHTTMAEYGYDSSNIQIPKLKIEKVGNYTTIVPDYSQSELAKFLSSNLGINGSVDTFSVEDFTLLMEIVQAPQKTLDERQEEVAKSDYKSLAWKVKDNQIQLKTSIRNQAVKALVESGPDWMDNQFTAYFVSHNGSDIIEEKILRNSIILRAEEFEVPLKQIKTVKTAWQQQELERATRLVETSNTLDLTFDLDESFQFIHDIELYSGFGGSKAKGYSVAAFNSWMQSKAVFSKSDYDDKDWVDLYLVELFKKPSKTDSAILESDRLDSGFTRVIHVYENVRFIGWDSQIRLVNEGGGNVLKAISKFIFRRTYLLEE